MQQMTFFLVPWFLAMIVLFALGLLLCIWVYRDAERRGMDGTLWLIIVLIANIVGLIIYLAVRRPEVARGMPPTSSSSSSTVKYCVQCGKPLPLDAKYCYNCGKEQM